MTVKEYDKALSDYQKATNRKRQLLTIVRMNKVWSGSGMGKRQVKRLSDITAAEAELKTLVIPPKPQPVIKGFQVYIGDDYECFVAGQDESEARLEIEDHFKANQDEYADRLQENNFTLKAIYTLHS